MDQLLTETQENYLEAIYDIIREKDGVRVKDIARKLEVKNSSVTVALRALRDGGHINYEPYGIISLTEKGVAEARRISETHGIIKGFFVTVLGIDIEPADEAACRMEHGMPREVLERFIQFIKFMSITRDEDDRWSSAFERFCRENVPDLGATDSLADYFEGIDGFTARKKKETSDVPQ